MRISLEEAASRLLHGEVVGIPTETVYGLAACLDNPSAIERIYVLKGRPKINPLIVHVSSLEEAESLTLDWGSEAKLLATLWPGPLTLILPARQDRVCSLARAGLPTVAIRIPQHPLCRELLKLTGPLVAPSANLSGRPSSSRANHVENDFGWGFPVLDGGPCSEGLESTIIWAQEPMRILRLGSMTAEAIQERSGLWIEPESLGHQDLSRPICPGQLLRHYAPQARIHLHSRGGSLSDLPVIGFSDRLYPHRAEFVLGASYDAKECAERLYWVLRAVDEQGMKEVSLDDYFPAGGLWDTLRERCTRAATSSAALPVCEPVFAER